MWVTHESSSYICMYIYAFANSVMLGLHLWNDFITWLLKANKNYVQPQSQHPPPPPPNKNFRCASGLGIKFGLLSRKGSSNNPSDVTVLYNVSKLTNSINGYFFFSLATARRGTWPPYFCVSRSRTLTHDTQLVTTFFLPLSQQPKSGHGRIILYV
jgi:hypothetical protein